MIRTPISQPVHPLELSYVELEILAKKALFRFSNIDIENFLKKKFQKFSCVLCIFQTILTTLNSLYFVYSEILIFVLRKIWLAGEIQTRSKMTQKIVFEKIFQCIMIRTPIMQLVHLSELSYVELQFWRKKALFRFKNIDI